MDTEQSKQAQSEDVLSRMRSGFPASKDQLIPMLQFVQENLGYLSPESMFGIAEYLKVPASHVYGVATFYAQFRFQPLGKNRITVCRGTACHVRGGSSVLNEIQKQLSIGPGETTDDLMFSLETVACVGSCALAPVVVVNKRVYGKVTSKKISEIIQELKTGKTPEEIKAQEEAAKKEKAAPSKPEKAEEVVLPEEAPAEEKPRKKAVKKAGAKSKGKAAKKKALGKKTAKKTGKKSAKKAAKKAGKKTAKKAGAKKAGKASAKKAAAKKKSVKKAAKKTAKKTSKKAARKAGVKKAAKKSSAGKKPAKKSAKKTAKKAAKKTAKKTAKKSGRKR